MYSYTAINVGVLVHLFSFSLYLLVTIIRNSLLSACNANNPLLVYWGYINSTAPSYDLDLRGLDHFYLPQESLLIHYIDNTMLIIPGVQDIATTVDILPGSLHVRGWEVNPKTERSLTTQGNFSWSRNVALTELFFLRC